MLPNGATRVPLTKILSAKIATMPSADSGVPGDAPVLPIDTVAPFPGCDARVKSVYVSGYTRSPLMARLPLVSTDPVAGPFTPLADVPCS